MEELVVKTRVTPKKLNDAILTRKRLINLINRNIRKNVFMITGPAGVGKTTLVIDYFNFIKCKYAWFYFASDIVSFRSFAAYLVYSLKELKPDFGRKTLELLYSMIESGILMSDEKNSITALMGTFLNEFLRAFRDDVYLVIDDFHNSGNPEWLTHTFNFLIEEFPPNLHIFITSRELPKFNIARLNAKRNLLKIEADELIFRIEETERLLKEIYSVQCGDKEIQLLDSRTEGWITGLHLILQAYGKNFSSLLHPEKRMDENIFLYFAEEIFKHVDKPTKEFLVITSMVDTFNENLCTSIGGIENAAGIIDTLKKKNIFLETLGEESNGGGSSYSYHNLFRQFLNTKLAELKSQDEIENIKAHIFEYYQKRNDDVNAIEFSLQAKKYKKAAELISNSFDELFKNGRYELLEKWLELLPVREIHGNTRLKYYKARLLKYFRVDLETSARILEEIISEDSKTSTYYILSRTELADILVEKRRPLEAAESLKELLSVSSEAKLRIKVFLCLTKAYYNMGAAYFSEIIKVLDQAVRLCEENEIREYHPEIYSYYGKFYLNAGDFSSALHYFRHVVRLEKNIYRKFQTITDIVLLYSWSGEYIKAKESLDEAGRMHERFPINIFKRDLMRVTALNAAECGDFECGIELLTRLYDFDTKNNIHTHTFWYLMLIGETYVKLGKKEKAKEYFKLAEISMDPQDGQQKFEFELNNALLSGNIRPNNHVEKILLNSLKYLEEAGLVYSKSQINFYLADFYYKTGELQTALKYMNDSLDIASQKGFNSFLIQDFIPKRYLFELTAANKMHVDFIQNIYTRLLERETYDWISAECRKRWENERDKLFDIRLNTLGSAEVFIRGRKVEENKWIRKKSKLLLIYLAVNIDLKHTKEKIMNMFFGELSPASAENIFHQAITNIRNVTKPKSTAPDVQDTHKGRRRELEKFRAEDPLVQYRDKVLSLAGGYNYYVDVNEFVKLSNKLKTTETDAALKELLAKKAIDLYKGEFLPGYYDEWIEELRMNLKNRFIELCEDLIRILKKLEKYDDITFYGEMIIREDRLNAEAFADIINAYLKSGNNNTARKKYSQLLKNYEEEYGERPGKDILDRIDSILDN